MTTPPARRRVGAVLSLAALATSTSLAAPALLSSARAASAAPAKAVPSDVSISAAAAVPHSSQILVLGTKYVGSKSHVLVIRRHGKKSTTTTVPTKQGDVINSVTAGSTSAAWVGGYRSADTQSPLLLRAHGKTWKKVKLPALGSGSSIASVSASSASNAWAAGYILTPDGAPAALHWNGKRWSTVLLHITDGSSGSLSDIATSSSTNAFAVEDDTNLLHWNGKAWSIVSSGGELSQLGTSSSTSAWALAPGSDGTLVEHWNGKKFTTVKTPKYEKTHSIDSLSVAGKSVWVVGSAASSKRTYFYAARSTGGSFHRIKVSTPGTSASLIAVAATSTHAAHAYGAYYTGKTCQTIKYHPVDLALGTSSGHRETSRAVPADAPDVSAC